MSVLVSEKEKKDLLELYRYAKSSMKPQFGEAVAAGLRAVEKVEEIEKEKADCFDEEVARQLSLSTNMISRYSSVPEEGEDFGVVTDRYDSAIAALRVLQGHPELWEEYKECRKEREQEPER